MQHELRPDMAVNVGYFRTWFGNFTRDRQPPGDAGRLRSVLHHGAERRAAARRRRPAGLRARTTSIRRSSARSTTSMTQSSDFGEREQVYDGIDAKFQGRFGNEGLLSGGWNIGRTRLNCVVVDAPVQFCDNRPPFLSEVKLGVSYPLPGDLRASAVIQNLPGSAICTSQSLPGGPQCAVTYVATNAEIAPSLGRNLAACGNVTVGCNAFATVNLIEPNTEFEDRVMQVDLRFSKLVRLGRARLTGKFDVYNIFNQADVARMVTFYGSSLLLPAEVMGGRLFKFGVQMDF